MSVSSELDAMR